MRSRRLLAEAQERITWADYLVGESERIIAGLRDAVTAFAQAERGKGEPPEKVVAFLKKLTVDAGESLEASEARSLVDDVVRWGIEAYYAA